MQLTAAGQVFLAQAQRVLFELEQAVEVGRQSSRGEIGQIVVGFVSSAAYNVLPEILRTFRAAVPAVTVELHELTTDQQLEWLRSGRIDVGLVRPPVEPETFSFEIIFQEPLMAALPLAHPLANTAQVSLQSLRGEPFILFPRSFAPGLYDQIISLCQQAEFSPTVVQQAIQMQTIVSLVAAKMGVAIVPASLQNLQRTGVVYKALQQPTPLVAIAAIWRCDNRSPTVERFLEIARQSLVKLPNAKSTAFKPR